MKTTRRGIPPLLLAFALLALMWLVAHAWPRLALDFPGRSAVGGIVAIAGLVVCGLTVRAFRRARTTVDPTRPERASTLVTGGLFAVSRNPMYIGVALVLVGWGVWLAHPVALLLPLVFVVYLDRLQVPREEQALAAAFGDEYARYAREVRRWL